MKILLNIWAISSIEFGNRPFGNCEQNSAASSFFILGTNKVFPWVRNLNFNKTLAKITQIKTLAKSTLILIILLDNDHTRETCDLLLKESTKKAELSRWLKILTQNTCLSLSINYYNKMFRWCFSSFGDLKRMMNNFIWNIIGKLTWLKI